MDLGQFFIKDYTGPAFELFGGTHLVTLLVVVLFIVLLLRFKGSSETVRSRVRWSMAIVLWLVEASWHIWNLEHPDHAATAYVQRLDLADGFHAHFQEIFHL